MAGALNNTQRRRVEEFIAQFRVEPGRTVKLTRHLDPSFKGGIDNQRQG